MGATESKPINDKGTDCDKVFPVSHKIIVKFKNLNFPENALEAHYTMQLFESLLENLPLVETSCLDKQQDRPEDGTLRIKIHVHKKYLPTLSIECLIDEVRHSMKKSELKEKLQGMGVAPTSIESLLENIFEPDRIEIEIEPPRSVHDETMALWPRDKTRLLELTPRNVFDIACGFTKTFGKEISWEDVAMELDALQNNDIYSNLQEKISKLGAMDPYTAVIREYKEQAGTVWGLLTCLDMIRNAEEETTDLRSKIDDLISSIHMIKESHFREWSKRYDEKKKASFIVDSYDLLKKALYSCSSQGSVIPQDFCEWGEAVRDIAEEGDQLWMWREGNLVKPSYAHVGIYIGDDSVVHVQKEGVSGIVKRDQVEAVIHGCKFFIYRPSRETLERICGTPKERALACLGLKFTYSVTSGNCEVFANIVSNGKWDVWDSVQGEEHSHVNRLFTVINGVSHFKKYQKQRRSLLSKMAKRLLLQGFIDSSLMKYNAAFKTIVDSYDGLKIALSSCSSHGRVLPQDFCEWGEAVRGIVEEGDQLWIWREGSFVMPSYAHVGIYIGDESMLHIQMTGLSGIVKRDQVEAVIHGCKFFIFRARETLERICGTPKERALACLGMKFIPCLTSEAVFAKIVCNARWNFWDSMEGKLPLIDRFYTVVLGVIHLKNYQQQQKSLVSEMGKRFILQGIRDSV